MHKSLKILLCIAIVFSIYTGNAENILNVNNLHYNSINNQKVILTCNKPSENHFIHYLAFMSDSINAGPGFLKFDATYQPAFYPINYINNYLIDIDNTNAFKNPNIKDMQLFINYTLNLGLGINALYKKSTDLTDINNRSIIEFNNKRYRTTSIEYYNLNGFSKYHIALSYNNNFLNVLGLDAYTWYDNITADDKSGYLIESSYGVQAKLKYNINNSLSVIGDIAYITYSDISASETNNLQSEFKISPALIISDSYSHNTKPEIKFFVTYGSLNNTTKDMNVSSVVQKTDENSFLAFGVHGEAWW